MWDIQPFPFLGAVLHRSLICTASPAPRVPAEPNAQNDQASQQPPRVAASYFIVLIYLSISSRLIELKLPCTAELPRPLTRFCKRWFFTLRSDVGVRPLHLRPPGLNPWGPGGCPLLIPSGTKHLFRQPLAPPCRINTCRTLSSLVFPSLLSPPSWNEEVLSPKWNVWNCYYGLRAFCFLGHHFLIFSWNSFFHCCWQLHKIKPPQIYRSVAFSFVDSWWSTMMI